MRRFLYTTAAFIFTVLCTVSTAQNVPVGCKGVRNDNPVLDLPAQPLNTVQNGQSWKMQQGDNIVYITKMKGTAYQMGEAFGQLHSEHLKEQFANIDSMYPGIIHDLMEDFGVPQYILNLLDDQMYISLAHIALDLNWKVASPYIPQRFNDEIEGMAAGSGVDVQTIRRGNILPELTQAHCTVFGAWGPATKDNKLLHFRGLDWDAFAPINQFPVINLYEPTEEGSHPFANIGYLGMIGTLTAISKIGISAGEKVMLVHDPSIYPEPPEVSYFGKPWMFVLRDTVQFSNNIVDVYNNLEGAHRTMKIHGGWASLPDNTFRGMNYAHNFLYLYDDKNYTHYDPVSHPQLDGVFFFDKHVQLSDDPCLPNIISSQHGQITPETMYRDVAGFHATGDNNYVVMDPAAQEIWVGWSQYKGTLNAFDRPIIHVKFNDFWTPSTFLQ